VTLKNQIQTQVIYSEQLPNSSDLSKGPLVFIVDDLVYKKNKAIQHWLKNAKYIYRVQGGERLKSLDSFPKHIRRILKIAESISHRQLTLVAIGGGSLGDFAGFVAAVFKRGVRFIQVPTTWLAAMDSSHGGKNALNVGSHKNQIGTFHHPNLVFISRKALRSQAKTQNQDALGELYKMALIEGHLPWAKKTLTQKKTTGAFLWSQLPFIVRAKYKVVETDPTESLGLRYVLNLGHTIGHVIELEMNLSHGNAVAAGLAFALWLSYKKNILSAEHFDLLKDTPMFQYCSAIKIKKLSPQKIKNSLRNDKKKDSPQFIKFVFLKKPGKTLILPIDIDELTQAFATYANEKLNLL
jgi:3-dehydroquinate synthase